MKYLILVLFFIFVPVVEGATITTRLNIKLGDFKRMPTKNAMASVKEQTFTQQLKKNIDIHRPTALYLSYKANSDNTYVEQLRSATIELWGQNEWPSMYELISHESGFNPFAQNGSSGACGLFQAMPCEKMGCEWGDVECQIKWGTNYIASRYGTPSNAWDFWQSRQLINGVDVGNWY